MSAQDEVLSQLEYLEVKVAYQEDTIEQLNAIVIKQQASIDALERKLSVLNEKIKALPSTELSNFEQIEKPPHY